MKDSRSDKVKDICSQYYFEGCRRSCPLSVPCKHQAGDTKEVFDKRMNEYAEGLENE